MQSNSSALLLVNCNTQSIFKNMHLPSEKVLEVRQQHRPAYGRKPNIRLLASQEMAVSLRTELRPVIEIHSKRNTLPRRLLALAGFQNPCAAYETFAGTRAVDARGAPLGRTVRSVAGLRNQCSDTIRFSRIRDALLKIPAPRERRAFVATCLTVVLANAAEHQNQQP